MRQRILIPYRASALSANAEAAVQGTTADAHVEWHDLAESFPEEGSIWRPSCLSHQVLGRLRARHKDGAQGRLLD
ncbi:exported hypothetical protein [Agrobacterium tumefaciens str. CFBP 5621]|jgi:hypothetical protein|nr:exported hypothetical protein [Agrobacterium tumefaciens str. CFBP 5621]